MAKIASPTDSTYDAALTEPALTGTSAKGEDRAEVERTLARLETLERYLDRRYGIAGFRFGWDSILGLIPGIGDTITGAMSAYLVWKAHKLGAPNHLKGRMIANVGLDYAVGLVPIVGDIGDALFKANTKNVRLLKDHLNRRA